MSTVTLRTTRQIRNAHVAAHVHGADGFVAARGLEWSIPESVLLNTPILKSCIREGAIEVVSGLSKDASLALGVTVAEAKAEKPAKVEKEVVAEEVVAEEVVAEEAPVEEVVAEEAPVEEVVSEEVVAEEVVAEEDTSSGKSKRSRKNK